MSYEDEQRILRKRSADEAKVEEEHQESVSSIFDGKVMVHNVETLFEERQLGNLPCYIYMPQCLRELSDKEKEVLFARTKPPKFAYGSEELILYVSVTSTDKLLKNEQIRTFLDAGKRPLESMIPQSKVYKSYVKKNGDKNVGCFEFVSGGIPMNMYNLMMFISINDELVIINIYTFNELKKRVFPYIEQMAQSLRIEESQE